jgi:alpha-tubulin suppressor-like RCC1 family protein
VPATALGNPGRLFAGADVTCTLDFEGHARCLGWNAFGQLGDGVLSHERCGADDCSRVLVDVAIPAGVDSIASVAGVTCFLSDGHVWCAGSSDHGLLGDGVATHGACPIGSHSDGDCAATPVEVAGLDDATALFGGSAFYAVPANGGLVAWGPNTAGGLGDGTTEMRNVPTTVQRP